MRRYIVITAAFLCFVSSAQAQPSSYEGYSEPMDLVDHWYQSLLHRSARSDSGSYLWVDQLRQGNAPNEVMAGILSSTEYFAKGGNTAEGFIRNLYADIMARQPMAGELQYWMQRALTQNIVDMETRKDLAYDLLTQNPGTAQYSYRTVPPVTTVVPAVPAVPIYPSGHDRDSYRHHDEAREGRDRDYYRHHDEARERRDHDYHRPYYPYRH